MFEPNAPICAMTWRLLPSPTASITTTEATPMMIPSRVSAVRKRLIHITRHAACNGVHQFAFPGPGLASAPSLRRLRRSTACRAPGLALCLGVGVVSGAVADDQARR
jgi:hypothetical protein